MQGLERRARSSSRVGWASRPPVAAFRRNDLLAGREVRERETRSPAGETPTLPETANR